MQVFGHRGNPGFPRYAENTLSSFWQALDAGAAGIEFDVRRCRDGAIVIIHDATVNRTTNGSGAVSTLDYDELRRLDAGRDDCIPLLSTVLDAFRNHRCILNIELKESGIADEAVSMARERKMLDRTIFSAFDFQDTAANTTSAWIELAAVASVAAVAPIVTRTRFKELGEPEFLGRSLAMKASAIHPPRDVATAELIRNAHDAGLAVRVWTVNDPDEVLKWRSLHVDAIMSDFPVRSIAALRNADAGL
jgi:glycerophosphoryl diester phosphodiesterase